MIQAGTKVSFPNHDPIFHNVFSLSGAKTFDLGNYPKGDTRMVTFPEPGIVYVNCHLHSNMTATIVVTPNRWFTKADREGHFVLPDVPPGKYTVVAWHKTAGYFRQQVQVGAGGNPSIEFLIPLDENGHKIEPQQAHCGSARVAEEISMRFRTRAFLLCFVPVALLLTGSFWAIQKLVLATVKNGLRSSLRENHRSIARLRSRTDLQNSRFLKVAGENAELKAGLQLLSANPDSAEAKATVEDQVGELCTKMGFDFLLVSDADGKALTGVLRTEAGIMPYTDLPALSHRSGLMTIGGEVYQIASVPIDQSEDNIGELSVGERLDLAGFNTSVAVLQNGGVLEANLPGIALPDIETALKACRGQGECEVRIGGQSYVSLALDFAMTESPRPAMATRCAACRTWMRPARQCSWFSIACFSAPPSERSLWHCCSACVPRRAWSNRSRR